MRVSIPPVVVAKIKKETSPSLFTTAITQVPSTKESTKARTKARTEESTKPSTKAGTTQGTIVKNSHPPIKAAKSQPPCDNIVIFSNGSTITSSPPMTDAKCQSPNGSIAIRSNDSSITENIKPITNAAPTQGINLKNITSSPPMTDATDPSDSAASQDNITSANSNNRSPVEISSKDGNLVSSHNIPCFFSSLFRLEIIVHDIAYSQCVTACQLQYL